MHGQAPASAAGHAAGTAPTAAAGPAAASPQDLERLRAELARPRLYIQLQVFTGARHRNPVIQAVEQSGLEAVVYQDFLDPAGIGVLLMAENPEFFVSQGRQLFTGSPFDGLKHRPELTMTGCTYSTGRDANPEDWMLQRPRRNARNPAWDWAVWYPLRRKPEFATLPREEQGKLLLEHATMARPYGDANAAADIRLSCYGIDANDNEFVLGLVGPQLFPLSHLVQEMRKSKQTAEYIQSLGPFFIGRVIWRRALQ